MPLTVMLAYANDRTNPLSELEEEDRRLNELFTRKSHLRLHRDQYATRQELAKYIDEFKEELILFHFSGHAGKDHLLLEDGNVKADGVAEALASCPYLRLVVLNGCSTEAQEQKLSQLPSKPVVITTKAAVGDKGASEFAKLFYDQLCDKAKTVKEAFDFAMRTERMQGEGPDRGVGLMSQHIDEWNIYPTQGGATDWKLPLPGFLEIVSGQAFQPNRQLRLDLLEILAEENEETNRIVEQYDEVVGEQFEKAVLKIIPQPISDQLRKLLAKAGEIGQEHTYFDTVSAHRIEQIGVVHQTLLEFVTFVLLSDLWSNLLKAPVQLQLPAAQQDLAKRLFHAPIAERGQQRLAPLIDSLIAAFRTHKLPFFMAELGDLPSLDDPAHPLGIAVAELEQIRATDVITLEQAQIPEMCERAEMALIQLFRYFSFLCQYKVLSIRQIRVQKQRHEDQAYFDHRIFELVPNHKRIYSEATLEMDAYLENLSVFLVKASTGSPKYLNLSPLIIDQTAYLVDYLRRDSRQQIDASEANLHAFRVFDTAEKVVIYKHIYKPRDQWKIMPRQFEIGGITQKHRGKPYRLLTGQLNALLDLLLS